LDAELEQRRLAAVAAAEDSDYEISWSSDYPDAPTLDERAAEQRAIVESFETLKDDAANARLEQCLQEDAAAHLAIAAARKAAEKQAMERCNNGADPSESK
jgi:flagellar motility protein MotE (MotC chaperone)